ncbi:hypothetical protein [Clostridium sp. KNHs214]|uniref:hypothetical protein n=1 Tax=Clostridium sp. KNHs214 TaxID=1540257 RepID=UPI000554E566|nr:hypothetical protein [Clostridium sp. KNHs214]
MNFLKKSFWRTMPMAKVMVMFLMFFMMSTMVLSITGNSGNTVSKGKVFNNRVYAKGNLKVDMDVGFDGYYKLNCWVPFRFKIENNLKDINGEVQIEIINENNQLRVYSKEVNLPLNSTKNIDISGVVGKGSRYVNVKILEDKKVVYQENKNIKQGSTGQEAVVGILSNDIQNLNYIKAVKSLSLGGNSAIINYINLTERDLIDENEEMDLFNIIILNDFDTSKLSNEQYKALKDWVKRGGILIIGTGSSYNKTLSIFKDDFLTGSIGNVKKINSSALYNILPEEKRNGNALNINSLELNFKSGEKLLEEGKNLLTINIKKGDGAVCLNSFDLGEEPLTSWNMREDFISALMQGAIKNSHFEKFYISHGNVGEELYSIRSALTNIPEMPLPKGNNILIIICIYIILVSPLSYIILKKKDKREYMWAVVPVLALVFVFIIYISGMGTRNTKNIANIINVIRIDKSGQGEIFSNGNIFSPKKADIKVKGNKALKIYPYQTEIVNRAWVAQGGNPNLSKNKKVEMKINQGQNNYVEFYDSPVFSNNTIKLKMPSISLGKMESNLSYYDGKYIGNIKNNTTLNLEDCYIVTKDSYIKIGSFKNSQEKVINTEGNIYGEIYNFVEAQYPTGDMYNSRNKNSSKENMRKNAQKRDIIRAYFVEKGINIDEPVLIGWSNREFIKGLDINEKNFKKIEKSLVAMPINISYKKGNKIEYPFGYFKPEQNGKDGGYSENEKIFYGKEYEATFHINEKVDIEKITMKYTLDILKGQEEIVTQFVWNVKDGKWQQGDFRDFVIEKKDLNKYLSKTGDLKIKFQMSQERTKGEIPKISVKGSVK